MRAIRRGDRGPAVVEIRTILATLGLLRDPAATKLSRLDYLEVLNRGIEVMDNTALTLCMDNGVPIVVFDLLKEGNMERVILGEEIGTLVGARA